MTELLTPAEAKLLREARIVLVKVGIRTRIRTQGLGPISDDGALAWRLGKLDEAADIAEGAVFNVLSTAHNFLDVPAAKLAMDDVYAAART